jgi:hypothetical protein
MMPERVARACASQGEKLVDLSMILQGLEGVAGPQMAEMGAKVGLTPEQVTAIVNHIGGQATAGETNPGVAVAQAAEHTGIDPSMIGGLLSCLTGGAAAGGAMGGIMGMATQMLDKNHDGSVIDDVMGMFHKK